jgi:acetate---CoA ligase (ADP-forming)
MLVRSVVEAQAAAKTIGHPVALKVQSPDIPHKTEAGAVALNIGIEDVGTAYERVLANAVRCVPTAGIEGVLVQAMAPAGREVILGINRDQRWGPLLMVGLGGILVETVRDVVLAPVPIDRDMALALLGRLAGATLLGPYRGMPEADTAALADLMVKLSQFAFDHAEDIAEVDLNPVIVHGKGDGITVVDALIVKRTALEAERHTAAE